MVKLLKSHTVTWRAEAHRLRLPFSLIGGDGKAKRKTPVKGFGRPEITPSGGRVGAAATGSARADGSGFLAPIGSARVSPASGFKPRGQRHATVDNRTNKSIEL
jgi:hypothetical protein